MATPEKPLIAIVDDDPSVCDGLADLLAAAGFATATFRDPSHFMLSEQVVHTACLVTDIRMPGMSGLDLFDHLAAGSIPVPTIVMTAFPRDVDRLRAQRAGVCGYLTKPFGESELLDCIRSALETRAKSGGPTEQRRRQAR